MRTTIIFIVLVLIGVVVWGIVQDSKPAVHIPTIPTATTQPQDLCYYRSDKTSGGLYDRAWMKLHIDGEHVTGEFNNYPAEKDSKIGTFEGTAANGVATVTWNSTAEGMSNKEELLVKFDDTQAQAAFGEMVQGANGVYVYKDKASAVYQSAMPVIDCAQLDEILAVEKYIRSADLKTLTKDSPVLGGSLYVSGVVVDPMTHTATVTYEDGHNAYKGIVAYGFDKTSKKVTVNTFTKSK